MSTPTEISSKGSQFTKLLQLFEQQRDYVDDFFDKIDVREADHMLTEIQSCQGAVFVSGVGKSGAVALKIATTFTSIGVKSHFLSPTDALHGDLGAVAPEDLVLLISKSGESDELIRLLPFLKARGARTICWISKENSRLSSLCDFSVMLPLKKELCPFDLAPTTSASIQMIFGDILAVALMESQKLTLDRYALNHPAGRIGKRISLKVSDVMIQGEALPLCSSHCSLKEVIGELSSKGCGCMLVVDHGELLGIFTDGDLRRGLEVRSSSLLEESLGELMTPAPLTVPSELLAWKAMEVMEKDPQRPVYVLPVMENGQLVGLVRMHDLVQAGL